MKINEVIQEGVWDNLKTAGQTIKQRAGIVGQNIKQGAGAVANKVGQTYQQTRQAQQQRFGQAAAQQFPQSKKWLGKDWAPQAQLRAKNIGTFAGDVAKTLGGAGGGVGGGSMYATATSTTPKNTVAAGTEIQTKVGKFIMTDQGWIDDTNKPVTDPNTVARLNSAASQHQDGSDVDPTKPEDPTAIPTVTSPGGILGPGGKPVQYDAQGKPIIAQ
jgi:hypothetical protein